MIVMCLTYTDNVKNNGNGFSFTKTGAAKNYVCLTYYLLYFLYNLINRCSLNHLYVDCRLNLLFQ